MVHSTSNSGRRVLVTSALPYSNGRLHVGHIAGAYLPADIYARYLRLRGVNVRFICGSDDHGVANMITASKEQKTPRQVAEFYNHKQKEDFDGLGISFDIYGATCSNPFHAKTSQDLFLSLYQKGCFEKQRTRQFYDEARAMFLPDRFVKGVCGYCGTADQNSDQCENCGKILDTETLQQARSVLSGEPAVVKETVHWFLDLSRFEGDVAEWLDQSQLRDHTRSYVKSLLTTGLVKRSMTRDLDWGIPLPIDDPEAKGKVLYVWFDAPIGYISNTKEVCQEREGDAERYSDWWKSDDAEIVHFIGEDNTIFHCVIWIAMLKAEGSIHLPQAVVVNQFLNFQFPGKEVEKMSKSRGTAVWIGDYLAGGNSPDMLRYYLTMVAPERSRSVFKPDDMIQRHNSELANILGNFVHRIISFTHKHVGPCIPAFDASKLSDTDRNFRALVQATHENLANLLEGYCFKAALETLMDFCRACNKYVDDKAPWVTRKTDMETTKVTLALALEAIHFVAVTLRPFLPFTADKIAAMLNLSVDGLTWEDALRPQPSGTPLREAVILFAKIEDEDVKQAH
jgi:methionyl-tRNA synthetase